MRATVAVTTTLLVSVSALLAGCTGDEAVPEADGDLQGSPGGGSGSPSLAPPPTPRVETVDVNVAGRLGVVAVACSATVGECLYQAPVPEETDHYIERPGSSLAAANLTLTWTPTSAATSSLILGIRLTNATGEVEVGRVAGASPLALRLELPDPALLEEETRVRVFVFNAQAFAGEPGDEQWAYVTGDQEFQLTGNVAFVTPGA